MRDMNILHVAKQIVKKKVKNDRLETNIKHH